MKKYSYLIPIFLLLVICWPSILLFGQSKRLLTRLEMEPVHLAAHRGAHAHSPENSIASIEEAIRLGLSFVELDVRCTSDGVLVLMHDKTLDRTTTGSGEVSQHTYAELQKLYLRTVPKGNPSVYRIPTLLEALRCCKGRIMVDIDFKEEREKYIEQTFSLIRDEKMEDEVMFFLYDYTQMSSLQHLNPKITLFPRARTMEELNQIVQSGITRIVHLDESFNDFARLQQLRKQGFIFWMNTLGEWDEQVLLKGKDVFTAFLEKYPFVRIIQTDYP